MTQSEAQIFGPIDDREFRLTTKFNAPGAKAFAICKGIVLIQPQAGSVDKVNLILRPYTQPITGFNIKYFIYRGLDKSNFFSTDQVIEKSETSSDLINRVNKDFISFHQKGNEPVPPFLAKYLGYNPLVQEDALMIDSFFFKETQLVEENGSSSEVEETAFELPMVDMGDSLGNFSATEAGIDIVLNYGDYQLPLPNEEFVFDLAYARTKEAVISLPNELSDFQKKVKREQIFQFLDAAAFFGFHSDGGKVKIDHNGIKVNKTAEAIYNEVILNFKTKNRLYLYIQSDRGRSYNFYGNYLIKDSAETSLKMGGSVLSMAEINYVTDGWPLIIDSDPQAHNESYNKLFLQLVRDNSANAMLYGQVAQLDNAQHNNFCDADNLKLPDSPEGNASSLTKIIELSNPSIAANGLKLNIASFNILLYQGKTYDYLVKQISNNEGSMVDVYSTASFFDDVFGLIGASPVFKGGASSNLLLMSSYKLNLVNHYADKKKFGISAVQTVVVEDEIETGAIDFPFLERVTYLTETIDLLNHATSLTGSITANTKSSASSHGLIQNGQGYKLPEPLYYKISQFTDVTKTITGLQLSSTEEAIPNKIILGLSKAENDLLKALISEGNLINPRLFLIDLFEQNNQLISVEGTPYQKYLVGIVSESNELEVKLKLPQTEIVVYSIDGKSHYSKDYSKYIIEPLFNYTENTIKTNIERWEQ
ncbi:hypothetical protein [Pedobacter gandavensis]|uniref:hypothetical protein n=1 Tax=Pedobacter gandavensis TaxID=2679963 RepID=UPI00292F108A|nr:hypothetical protein [Pedobacter gandavensis]